MADVKIIASPDFPEQTAEIVGALWGARKQKEICFDARFKDGRKFLGIADTPTFQKLKAVTFR